MLYGPHYLLYYDTTLVFANLNLDRRMPKLYSSEGGELAREAIREASVRALEAAIRYHLEQSCDEMGRLVDPFKKWPLKIENFAWVREVVSEIRSWNQGNDLES